MSIPLPALYAPRSPLQIDDVVGDDEKTSAQGGPVDTENYGSPCFKLNSKAMPFHLHHSGPEQRQRSQLFDEPVVDFENVCGTRLFPKKCDRFVKFFTALPRCTCLNIAAR
jgi:hypothetical protein